MGAPCVINPTTQAPAHEGRGNTCSHSEGEVHVCFFYSATGIGGVCFKGGDYTRGDGGPLFCVLPLGNIHAPMNASVTHIPIMNQSPCIPVCRGHTMTPPHIPVLTLCSLCGQCNPRVMGDFENRRGYGCGVWAGDCEWGICCVGSTPPWCCVWWRLC